MNKRQTTTNPQILTCRHAATRICRTHT